MLEKETKIVHVNAHHGFSTFLDAEKWAGKNIAGEYLNKDTGQLIVISKKAISKYVSDSAVRKSADKETHIAALKHLPELIEESILCESHPDNENNPHIEEIQRLYAACCVSDNVYRVKMTVKVYVDKNQKRKAYSYEVAEIKMLGGKPTGADFYEPVPCRTPSISMVNLLKGAKKTNGEPFFR